MFILVACGRGNIEDNWVTSTPLPRTPTSEVVATKYTPVNLPIMETTTRLRDQDEMEMVFISAGLFEMGRSDTDKKDESPAHAVFLDGYWIDRFEVTNAQYARCVKEGGCLPPRKTSSYSVERYFGNPEYENFPVVWVDWNQSSTYCKWVGGRLPSEAEWEKAARGTEGLIYPWGDQAPDDRLLSFNQEDATEVGSHPAGASPYGVMDMAGNVWEWVADWYDSDYYLNSPQNNPTGPATGVYHVERGGAWEEYDWSVATTHRYYDKEDGADYLLGFRCVVDNSD